MLENWKELDGKLVRQFVFPDFPSVIKFMSVCVPYIEKLQHHPEWKNIYQHLEVSLTTHEAANTITNKDIELAGIFEHLYKTFNTQQHV